MGTATFRAVKDTYCPACMDRGALNLLAQPIFFRGARLTGGCDVCGGSGKVETGQRIGDWPATESWVIRNIKEKKEK